MYKRIFFALAAVGIVLVSAQVRANAQETGDYTLVITEIRTGNEASASNEYVELQVVSDSVVDLGGLKVQYASASGSSWTTKAQLSGSMHGSGKLLIAREGMHEHADFVLNPGFAGSGGHVRIVDASDGELVVLDVVGWGSAAFAEGNPVAPPERSQSIKRIVGEDGAFIDSDNNVEDLIVSDTPKPESFGYVVFEDGAEDAVEDSTDIGNVEDEPEGEATDSADSNNEDDAATHIPGDEDESPTDTEDETQEGAVDESDSMGDEEEADQKESQQAETPASYAPLTITELHIDPEKPQTDAEDEFIEIYNPNSFAVNLAGYTLQTGNTWRYSFTFPEYMLGSSEYFALFSTDSNLTLSNSGGAARLLDPNEQVIDEAEAYEKAKEGYSWQLTNGAWNWSSSPTPAAQNVVPASAHEGDDSEDSPAAASGSGSFGSGGEDVSLAASEAKSTSNTYEASGQGGSSSSESGRSVYQEPERANDSELNTPILVGVGGLTVLYAGYEYRSDIANRLYQLRRFVSAWVAHWRKA